MDIVEKYTKEIAEKVASNPKLIWLLSQRMGDGGFVLRSRTDEDQDGNISITFYPEFDEFKYKVYSDD